jgi:hypothetical protein
VAAEGEITAAKDVAEEVRERCRRIRCCDDPHPPSKRQPGGGEVVVGSTDDKEEEEESLTGQCWVELGSKDTTLSTFRRACRQHQRRRQRGRRRRDRVGGVTREHELSPEGY